MLIVIIFLLCTLISICSIRYVAKFSTEESKPLRDTVHNIADKFNFLSKCHQVPEIVIGMYTLAFIILCTDKITDFLMILSILLLVRAVSYNVTVLPTCDTRKDLTFIHDSLWTIIKYYVMNPFSLGGINDLLFSGHCSFLTLLTLFLTSYGTHVLIFKMMLWIVTCIISFLIVALRRHYTIDIMYAFIVTHYVFIHYDPLLFQTVSCHMKFLFLN